MSQTVDYYLAPHSPWTYLGHRRFIDIATAAGARVNVLPVDLAKVFPVSGGLPLAQRAPQRQAYRLLELRRFSAQLGLPITLKPRFFPVDGNNAARLIIAVDQHDGSEAAMSLAEALLRGVWVEERDLADQATLAGVLAALQLPARRLDDAKAQAVRDRYESHTQRAIDSGVFGAPSFVIDGELFWGQDRLDFVQRRLAQA